jgi:hypothetical protein
MDIYPSVTVRETLTKNSPYSSSPCPERQNPKRFSDCHTTIRVEAYRAQNGPTQCHNCQQIGHSWANCKQPPRCLWCGDGHLHKEHPEKENAASTPACCNYHLAEGEKVHPANYRGCRHAKEELQKRKSQRTPKTTTGRVFSSNLTTPGISFTAALRGSIAQQQRPQAHQVPVQIHPYQEIRMFLLLNSKKKPVSQFGLQL